MARSPGFMAAAVFALALAIGANVAVFTLANAFLFTNLPFDDSDRIFYISSVNSRRPEARGISYPDDVDLRAAAASLEETGALTIGSVDLRRCVGSARARLGGGLVFGVAGALVSTRVLESMLVGVSAADPATLALACGALALTVVAGCLVPVRRALRVDPLVALRAD